MTVIVAYPSGGGWSMGWCGYFVNLDRSASRRAAMEAQLAAAGLEKRYRRFPAVDGRKLPPVTGLGAGEVGIFRSHMELLRIAADSAALTHVIEDDVRLARSCGTFIGDVARRGLGGVLDVIVTDTGFALDLDLYRKFQQLAAQGPAPVQIVDISRDYRWGMTSYIVSSAGARKLLAEVEAEWALGPRIPVDVVLHRAATKGSISIGCSFPLMSWLDMEYASASLADRADESPFVQMVQRLARYPFFADADIHGFLLPTLRRLIDDVTACGEDRLHPLGRRALRVARRLQADCSAPRAAGRAGTAP